MHLYCCSHRTLSLHAPRSMLMWSAASSAFRNTVLRSNGMAYALVQLGTFKACDLHLPAFLPRSWCCQKTTMAFYNDDEVTLKARTKTWKGRQGDAVRLDLLCSETTLPNLRLSSSTRPSICEKHRPLVLRQLWGLA